MTYRTPSRTSKKGFVFTASETAWLANTVMYATRRHVPAEDAITCVASVPTAYPSEVTIRTVNKAVEENLVSCIRTAKLTSPRPRRHLASDAVLYLALARNIKPWSAPKNERRRLVEWIRACAREPSRESVFEFGYMGRIDWGSALAPGREIIDRYLEGRETYIVSDPKILGGTPVIRGTRISVYSIADRIDDGETLDDLAAENPDLDRGALEAALAYARANPPSGRPRKRFR